MLNVGSLLYSLESLFLVNAAREDDTERIAGLLIGGLTGAWRHKVRQVRQELKITVIAGTSG
jgi:hypothetical protein